MKKNRRGFTLIELIVVIAIIAALAAVGLVSYRTTLAKGRDGRRKADLEQVRIALEMYRSDWTAYPNTSYAGLSVSLVTNRYLQALPSDPRGYLYYYNTPEGGGTYQLCAYLESGGTADCGSNCGAPGNCNYQVTSP